MRKTSTPFVDEEISKLKLKLEGRDHHHPEAKENIIPPNLIDSPLDQRNLKDEKLIKLASGMELDELAEATQFMKELFEAEVKAGNIPSSMSYGDWIASLRTSLSGGGKVIKFSDFKKPKGGVKKINLSDYFDLGRTLSSLSRSERETLNWLLNKSFPKK